MATHSSTLAWKIPWMEEPGSLQSMGSLRVGHDWAISLSLFTFMHWRRKWQPTPVFFPGESHGWRGLVGFQSCTRVAPSWTRLKWLNSNELVNRLQNKYSKGFPSTPTWNWDQNLVNRVQKMHTPHLTTQMWVSHRGHPPSLVSVSSKNLFRILYTSTGITLCLSPYV